MDLPVEQKEAVCFICQQNSIVRLAAFGSRVRNEFHDSSDLDLLVEFAPGRTSGFFGLAKIAQALSEVFECPVDLRTPRDLSRHFREEVANSAEVLYAA